VVVIEVVVEVTGVKGKKGEKGEKIKGQLELFLLITDDHR
jgi:hypothetical protein